MPCFYLRFLIITFLPFTAALLLFRAQPYDDHELRELLLPEGCPSPCFMGIRPDVTTRAEVIQLLEASQQIEIGSSNLNDNDYGVPMLLLWNKNRPRLVQGASQLTIVYQNTKPKKVAQILFRPQPEIAVGDIYLILGTPSRYLGAITNSSNNKTRHRQVRILYLYDEYHVSLLTISDCPLSLTRLLQQPVARIEYDAKMRMDGLKQIQQFPNCR